MTFTLTLREMARTLDLRDPLRLIRQQGQASPGWLRTRTVAAIEAAGVYVDRDALLFLPRPRSPLREVGLALARKSTPEATRALAHVSMLADVLRTDIPPWQVYDEGLQRRQIFAIAQRAVDLFATTCAELGTSGPLTTREAMRDAAIVLRNLPPITDEVSAIMAVSASPAGGLPTVLVQALRMFLAAGKRREAQALLATLSGVPYPSAPVELAGQVLAEESVCEALGARTLASLGVLWREGRIVGVLGAPGDVPEPEKAFAILHGLGFPVVDEPWKVTPARGEPGLAKLPTVG